MIRFWRLLFFLFGVFLFSATIIRAMQPVETTGTYRIIYGDIHTLSCCAAYMINEDKRTANRVRLGVTEQPVFTAGFSPSGQWRFVNVSTPQGYRSYFISLPEGDLMRLPPEVDNVQDAHWALDRDVLYYLQRSGGYESALFRITPQEPVPVQLTGYIFGAVRSIHEQPLPHSTFTPWMLLFYSVNMLVIAGALKYSQWR